MFPIRAFIAGLDEHALAVFDKVGERYGARPGTAGVGQHCLCQRLIDLNARAPRIGKFFYFYKSEIRIFTYGLQSRGDLETLDLRRADLSLEARLFAANERLPEN